MEELKMLSQDEVAELLNTTRQHISILRDIGILRATKTGKGYMFSQQEIKEFQEQYKGYDVSNKFKAIESYKTVNNIN